MLQDLFKNPEEEINFKDNINTMYENSDQNEEHNDESEKEDRLEEMKLERSNRSRNPPQRYHKYYQCLTEENKPITKEYDVEDA